MSDKTKRLIQLILENAPPVNVFTYMSASDIDRELEKLPEDSYWIDLLGVDDFEGQVPSRFRRSALVGYIHGRYEQRMVAPVGQPRPLIQ